MDLQSCSHLASYIARAGRYDGIIVIPLSEEIVSARKMCPGDIFSQEILSYRTGYTVHPGTNCPHMFFNSFPHEGASWACTTWLLLKLSIFRPLELKSYTLDRPDRLFLSGRTIFPGNFVRSDRISQDNVSSRHNILQTDFPTTPRYVDRLILIPNFILLYGQYHDRQ